MRIARIGRSLNEQTGARKVSLHCSRVRAGLILLLFLIAAGSARTSALAAEQDLLNDDVNLFSGATLQLRPYVTLPGTSGNRDIISMTTRPGDSRLYVTTQEGPVYVINKDGSGNTTPTVWFNASTAVQAATGRPLEQLSNNAHAGLQSLAFHPDFENVGMPGYGKFYTTLLERKPPNDSGHTFLGNTSRGSSSSTYPDSVLVEWTYNHATGQVDSNSYREVFRVRLPVLDHMIKQARFNLYARPGDEDYGLLYLTHGDSSSQQSTEDRPRLLNNALGKMIRINPLDPDGNSPARYSIPTTNPFYNNPDPNILEEIYAYGMRNPHNFSFNKDDQGTIRILDGDIGRNNIEEVNLVTSGGFYSWTEREGTFVHLQGTVYPPNANPDAGYIYGVTGLPANEASVLDSYGKRTTYPVAQYDHNAPGVTLGADYVASAVASGFVIRNGSDPELENQFIFTNFGGHLFDVGGPVFQTDFDEMLGAVTQLDPDDPARDEPGELTQAVKYRLHLELDDANATTPPQADDLNVLLSGTIGVRNEARFGEGVFGEMYISSKTTGIVYLVTNSLPVPGDYNQDRVVDGADYVAWRDTMGDTGYRRPADGNGDGAVEPAA